MRVHSSLLAGSTLAGEPPAPKESDTALKLAACLEKLASVELEAATLHGKLMEEAGG